MAAKSFSQPVEESVSKVNDEIEVGEDLDFQRKWWRFENFVWILFSLIIVLDLGGLFGRGPVAKAERRAADGTIDVRYERIERTASPSILTIRFGQSAIVDGKIKLFISESDLTLPASSCPLQPDWPGKTCFVTSLLSASTSTSSFRTVEGYSGAKQ
jgi:hypothetical protein